MPTTTANRVAPSIMAAVMIIAVEICPAAAGCRAIDSTAEPLAVAARFFDDLRGFVLRRLNLRDVFLQARVRLVPIVLRVGERTVDELLALLQQRQYRAPGKLAEHEDDEQEDPERPDGVAQISRERTQAALGGVLLGVDRECGEEKNAKRE